MLKWITVTAVVGVLLVLPVDRASAFIGFGARVGFDDTSFDAYETDFGLGSGTATVVREEIERPLILGGTVGTGLLPLVDFELAAEVAFSKYRFAYTTDAGQATSDDVYYTRASVLATLKRNLVSFPPVTPVMSVYLGGGVGLHYVTPLVGEDLVLDKLSTPTEELVPDDVIEYQLKPGAHGLVGVRLKPPVLPFSVSAEARYIVKSKGDFEEPGSHMSVYVGAALGM